MSSSPWQGANSSLWDLTPVSKISASAVAISNAQPLGGHVTISNSEFDGVTPYSATCNNKHYWALLGMGTGDQVSVYNN
jgi:pectin lyase